MEYYSAIKKEWNLHLLIYNNMDGRRKYDA